MKMTLGQKIKELRIRKGFTQSELSEGLVTPSMISQIESDKANPSHQLLTQIAEKLETPIEYFLTDVESQLEKISAYKLAHAVMQKGDYEEAITLLSQMDDAPSTQISVLDIQYDLAYCYMRIGELGKATQLFEGCLDAAIVSKDLLQMVRIMNQLGSIAIAQKNYPIALHYLKKAYDLVKKEMDSDPFLIGDIAYQLGKIHSQAAEWDLAKEYFEEASAVMKDSHDIRRIADVYLELARTYRESGNFEQSLHYAQSASGLYQALDALQIIIEAEAQTGIVLGETGATDAGIEVLDRCMTMYENYGFKNKTGSVHAALARVLFQDKEFEKAIHHCQKALEYTEPGDLDNVSIYRMLATIELERDNYQQALQWIDKAAKIAEKNGASAELVKVFAVYGDIFKKQGKYKEAMESLEKMNKAMVEDLRDRKVMV
ncbi:helix-turn-helix domain-containing protein [Effusibacillus lacus]|uniref:Transcriptional regulator n=1 Tax=Effusibacillus lacus TaxID=1348429 RepID=A0A292YQU3_9BACL|nr:helix-turn-helix domain-containing protein [Effusibacillus lacus]TCS76789.1 Tfp pilus assembly protein PilF [Effusibacillus lacus]GAX91123.1 transcriptional regulator [Effusibacillus lacus]